MSFRKIFDLTAAAGLFSNSYNVSRSEARRPACVFGTTEARQKSKRQKPQGKHVCPHLSVYKNVNLYSLLKTGCDPKGMCLCEVSV